MADYNSSYTGPQIDTAVGAALGPDSTTPVKDSTKLVTSGAVYPVSLWFGTCDTGASTQIKAVAISGITALTTGLSIRVKFVNAQSYNGQPQLNLNQLGAVAIKRKGDSATGANAARYEWLANEVVDFVYDGSNWLIVDGGIATTTYYGYTKLSSSTSSTSTALAATPSAVKAAYDLAAAAVPSTEKGAANGVATLGADVKVPVAQIPADAAPTSESTNLVTSGGIYSYYNNHINLYSQSKDVSSANTSIELSESMAGYSFLVVRGYAGGTAAQQRFVLTIPVLGLTETAWYPIATSVGAGGIRLSGSSTTLTFVGHTYTSLTVYQVYGKR